MVKLLDFLEAMRHTMSVDVVHWSVADDGVVCRWDNDEVEKLSPWDLVPLEDCSMSNFFCFSHWS